MPTTDVFLKSHFPLDSERMFRAWSKHAVKLCRFRTAQLPMALIEIWDWLTLPSAALFHFGAF